MKMSEEEIRGILTSKDKAWLRGETEYQHRQSENNRRQEIRERVSSALRDFSLLIEHWPTKERQKALDDIDKEQSAAEIIEFLYLALNEPASDAEQMMDDESVDQALALRRALCRGIREGKTHFGDPPETVLIDSNTDLFELPSKEGMLGAIDTDQWRDANDYIRGAIDTPEDTVIEKETAAQNYHMELHLAVERELYTRRNRSADEIKRHNDFVGSTGL